jgi:hypothetical protein
LVNAGTLAEIRPLPVAWGGDGVPAAAELSSALELISRARSQLADGPTLSDVQRIIEAAALAEDGARRVAKLAEAQRLASQLVDAAAQAANEAATVRIEAQVKAGLLVRALKETGALAGKGRPRKMSQPATFSDAGIERREAHRWQRVAAVPEATRREYLQETRAAGRQVTTDGLLRHAARMASRAAGLDPALIAAQARRDIRRVHRGLVELPSYRPEALVSALDGGERRKLLATLSDVRNWIEDVRRELAIHGVVDGKEG